MTTKQKLAEKITDSIRREHYIKVNHQEGNTCLGLSKEEMLVIISQHLPDEGGGANADEVFEKHIQSIIKNPEDIHRQVWNSFFQAGIAYQKHQAETDTKRLDWLGGGWLIGNDGRITAPHIEDLLDADLSNSIREAIDTAMQTHPNAAG